MMTKYWIVIKNRSDDNLAIAETFDDAVGFLEKNSAMLPESYRIQLLPKNKM